MLCTVASFCDIAWNDAKSLRFGYGRKLVNKKSHKIDENVIRLCWDVDTHVKIERDWDFNV